MLALPGLPRRVPAFFDPHTGTTGESRRFGGQPRLSGEGERSANAEVTLDDLASVFGS